MDLGVLYERIKRPLNEGSCEKKIENASDGLNRKRSEKPLTTHPYT